MGAGAGHTPGELTAQNMTEWSLRLWHRADSQARNADERAACVRWAIEVQERRDRGHSYDCDAYRALETMARRAGGKAREEE